MDKCRACGSLLSTAEYQARSADEAPRSITECVLCPIRPNKLNFSINTITNTTGFEVPPKRPRRATTSLVTESSKPTYRLTLVCHKDISDYDVCDYIVAYKPVLHKRSASENTTPLRCTVSVSSPWGSECTIPGASRRVGVQCAISELKSVRGPRVTPTDTRHAIGKYSHFGSVAGKKSALIFSCDGSSCNVVVNIGTTASASTISHIIQELYAMGNAPRHLSDIMAGDRIAQLNSLSARAWDVMNPPLTGYTFTSKPDGERVWMVKVGYVWYLIPKAKPRIVRSWITTPILLDHPLTWVLDVEYVLPHSFILIDVIVDVVGNPSPISRDTLWCIDELAKMKLVDSTMNVESRTYFNSAQEARLYSELVPYPVDGVVAVRDGSTEILKVKDIKSAELLVNDAGLLVSLEGRPIVKNMWNYQCGDIVEIRFSKGTGTTIDIHGVMKRKDKSVANSNDAVDNIIRSLDISTSNDDGHRRTVLLWCNRLRESIKQRAISMVTPKHIILDIGTGTGQSVDSMISQEHMSYILVEPSSVRCSMISRRLTKSRTVSTALEVLPLLKSLQTRALQFVIVNCSVAELIEDAPNFEIISKVLRCATCTFSMQFDIPSLHKLLWTHHIPIYGCCYVYDMMDAEGYVVNKYQVTMRANGDNSAHVKWGSDESYTEPLTLRNYYHGLGKVVNSANIVPLPSNTDTDITQFSNSIIVVVP